MKTEHISLSIFNSIDGLLHLLQIYTERYCSKTS